MFSFLISCCSGESVQSGACGGFRRQRWDRKSVCKTCVASDAAQEKREGHPHSQIFRFWIDQLGWSVTTFAAGPLCCDCLLLISQVSVMSKGTVWSHWAPVYGRLGACWPLTPVLSLLTRLPKICCSSSFFSFLFNFTHLAPCIIFPFNPLNNTPLQGLLQTMALLPWWRCLTQPHLEPLHGPWLPFSPLTNCDKGNSGSFTAVTHKDKLLRY